MSDVTKEFAPLEGGTEFLKATFQGFPKSGKSYTATRLAIGVRSYFKLTAPIAYHDTEGAVGYLAPMIRAETGEAPVGKRSRNLNDAVKLIRWAEAGNASVVVIDSVSHLWKNLCDGYLDDVNAARVKKRKAELSRLPFAAWGVVKPKWAEFMDVFMGSAVHVILCGRVAFEYDVGSDDEGQQELRKTGVKISAEKDTGYESSLLVEMERVQKREANLSAVALSRRATVLGDRFGVLDGAAREFTKEDPAGAVFEFFLPHVALLDPTRHAPPDMKSHPETGAGEDGDAEWQRRRREREIVLEEIEHEIVLRYPGQTKDEKVAKAKLVEASFGSGSWKAVESMDLDKLRAGLDLIRRTPKEAA